MLAILAKCTVGDTRLMFVSANEVSACFTDFARLKPEIPATESHVPIGLLLRNLVL
jgi:hypothetical protein